MDDLVVVGAGGQARELLAMVGDLGSDWKPIGFVDDAPSHLADIHGLGFLGDVNWLESHPELAVVVGIGSCEVKRSVVERIRAFGPRTFPTLVHPTASVGPGVSLGEGVFVCAGAILTTDITVGSHVLLNFGCTVGHDARIDDLATIAPGAHVSGNVHVGEGSYIGTGVSIIQGVSIGEWAIIGAGAAVVQDAPANATSLGVPARVVEQRDAGWHLGAG